MCRIRPQEYLRTTETVVNRKESVMAKQSVPEIFGSMVFDDRVMRARLSADVYNSLRKTIDENARLEEDIAQVVAEEMRSPCYL